MAPRSIWNGTLTFGEVVVPVKLFPETQDRSIHFHEVRLKDGCRIEHRRVGAESGRAVPAARVAKAYETSRGHQVLLSDEEIAAARGSRPKVIELQHFVAAEQIDPVYYDHAYLLGAQEGGERAYRVLLGALERTGRVGIGRFVLRTREQLVALRPRGRALTLHTMRFADEVVDRADLDVPALRRQPSPQELKMAEQLVRTLARPWQPARHEDRYRAAVHALIERKAKGEQIDTSAPPAPAPAEDLAAALKASLGGGSKRKTRRTRAKPRTKAKA